MATEPALTAEYVAPTKWRKRPVVIEAMRLTWDNRRDVAHWCGGEVEVDWVIKGVADEFYPCKPTIFAATYERHSDGSQVSENLSNESRSDG